VSIFGKSKKSTDASLSGRDHAALPPAPATVISDGTKVIGDIIADDQIQINGELEGSLKIKNHVIVGKTGKVSANMEVGSLQVFGKVIGDVVSIDRVTIERSGSIEGNIIAPKLAISEGAIFRGNIDMSQRKAKPDQKNTAVANKPYGYKPASQS
jgi:cytoskeletal protein CcmA (bactofilin family)